MKTILATGGTGYIGSHTCLELLKKGYKVIILDNLVNSSEKVISKLNFLLNDKNLHNNLTFIKGDINDEKLLDHIFKLAKEKYEPISCVMHFAGLKSVSESLSNPLQYWHNNVGGSIILFKLMEKYECRTVIFSSSATIYQINEDKLLNESSPINPINPYGQTKLAIERLLKDLFDKGDNWRIANLRYFNPIGAHQSGLIGENPKGMKNNIFPILNGVAIGEIEKLKIYGNNWSTYDGTGVRDFIHVMDLAEGHIKALEYLENNEPQILNLNLGTGKGTSVLGLIKIFENVNKVKINYEFTNRRKGDYGIVIADNSLAKSLLKWTPKKSLEDMCVDGWRWQNENLKNS